MRAFGDVKRGAVALERRFVRGAELVTLRHEARGEKETMPPWWLS